ncbi:MAG: GNAT family N-acetyltransferase, partial [Pigmentiphaga sp.]
MSDTRHPHHHIRPMRHDELGLMLEWARAEGWNPGLHDADAFHATDPDGFLLAQVDDQPVSCISAVRYGSHFGFLGFYIVPPELRGQGHGAAVWHAALARLEGRQIGLDGVPAQQENYRRSGFTLAHRNIRFEGTNFPAHTASADPGL